jgi:hypothetical protein
MLDARIMYRQEANDDAIEKREDRSEVRSSKIL